MSWRYCSLALSHRYSIRFQDFRLCHPQTTSLSPFSFVNTALILLCFLVIFITLIVSLMCLGSIYVNCAAHSCRFGGSVARGTPYVGISYVWHCYLDGPEKRQGCKYAYSSMSYIFLKGNFRTNSFSCEMCLLTHWGRDKMAAISQMAFSNTFSWKKKYKFRLRFPQGTINNIPALVQIMAWRLPGDKLLSEPMMVRLPTHICITRAQWLNVSIWLKDCMGFKSGLALKGDLVTGHYCTYTDQWGCPRTLTHICITRLQRVNPPGPRAQVSSVSMLLNHQEDCFLCNQIPRHQIVLFRLYSWTVFDDYLLITNDIWKLNIAWLSYIYIIFIPPEFLEVFCIHCFSLLCDPLCDPLKEVLRRATIIKWFTVKDRNSKKVFSCIVLIIWGQSVNCTLWLLTTMWKFFYGVINIMIPGVVLDTCVAAHALMLQLWVAGASGTKDFPLSSQN